MEKLRKAFPSIITFTTLSGGMASIALSMEGHIGFAASLILVGYILDTIDGELARRLEATSDFGVQLDSLVDIVNFGAAGAALVWSHLRASGYQGWIIWPVGVAFVIAGAYRLARFNLSASDFKITESVGLTISTSGAYVALAVLADRAFEHGLLPNEVFLILLPLLAALMVSRINFPELKPILRRRRMSVALLSASVIAAIWLSPQVAWWGLTTGYISFGIFRAGYRMVM